MSTSTPATNASASSGTPATDRAAPVPFSAAPVSWNRITGLAFGALIALWAGLFGITWASWGHLTVDCGRELYVAAALAKGQTLYRDVWYLYGPLAPYVNGFLFRMFGIRLEVLYWAGSLSALGSAIFLYLAGMRLSSWLVGWTAGAVVLLQAFGQGIFCFPLPYAFPSVYGCFVACLLLWLGLHSVEAGSTGWIFAAGITACVALLLKLEYGFACYAFLFLLVAMRAFRSRSGKRLLFDLVAILPGIVACVLVIGWMVSLRGVAFITQENIASWPTSYFMRTYGKHWLGMTGVSFSSRVLAEAVWPMALFAAIMLFLRRVLQRLPGVERWFFPAAVVLITLVTAVVGLAPAFVSYPLEIIFQAIFFPRPMLLLVALTGFASAWLLWRRKLPASAVSVIVLSAFSCLLAFRLWLSIYPQGYSIYYDGPVVLCFLLFGQLMVPAGSRWSDFRPRWELLLCFGCLAAVAVTVATSNPSTANWAPLRTEYGDIRVPRQTAAKYTLALDFIKEHAARGEYILSVPEDTSLYFLSGTECPSRLFMFTPGVLAPGRMTEQLIRELESKPVRYLLWSNRKFPEYGVPVFGKDYDQIFGSYLRIHYRPLRSLTPEGEKGWSAVIWQKVQEGESP